MIPFMPRIVRFVEKIFADNSVASDAWDAKQQGKRM
jgi:hypothetical protein